MAFVSVNCAPITAGALVDSTQVTGGVKLNVDCSVKPTAFVGQERMSSLPLNREFNNAIADSLLTSATAFRPPAAIAMTPVNPSGTGPVSAIPHVTTEPSF